MNKITIAVKEPAKPWRKQEAENTLETFQKIVGGYIELCLYGPNGVLIFGNEEGKLLGMVPNIELPNDTIVGTVFAVRSNDEGDFISLYDEDFDSLGVRQ